MNLPDSKAWRQLVIAAIAIFAVYQFGLGMISSLSGFLILLLFAWLISIAMEPPVSWFERRGYKRGLGAGIVILGLLAFFIAFFATFGSLMFSQLAEAVAAAPEVIKNVTSWLNSTFDLKLNASEITKSLNLETATITPIVTNLAGGLIGVLSSLMTAIFELATVLVFAFYLSADAHKVKRGIASWLPADRQRVFLTVWEIAVIKTGGFVISRVVLASISAVAHAVVYYAIGLPYWLPMGIFAGISAQFVPTVGTYLGVIVPVLFSIGNDTTDILWIVGFAAIFQQIETYVLTPRVSRATMDLHPAVAMASAFFGVALFGPVGAFIGMPILAGIIAVIGTYGQRHELIPDLGEDQ
ncbi:MAG: hypothetical protein RLZZ426_1155 [Actinomycetota bacterium]